MSQSLCDQNRLVVCNHQLLLEGEEGGREGVVKERWKGIMTLLLQGKRQSYSNYLAK